MNGNSSVFHFHILYLNDLKLVLFEKDCETFYSLRFYQGMAGRVENEGQFMDVCILQVQSKLGDRNVRIKLNLGEFRFCCLQCDYNILK